MSKTKSVVMTVIISIVVAILSLMCFVPSFNVPFSLSGVYKTYNSVVNVVNYGSDLGGGYSATYYPEGVMSVEEYTAQVNAKEAELEEAKTQAQKDAIEQKYSDLKNFEKYTKNGVGKDGETLLYVKKNVVFNGEDGKILPSFNEDFETAVEIITKRFDDMHLSYLSVDKVNDYAIRVTVPSSVEDYESVFAQMGANGQFFLATATSVKLSGNGENGLDKYFKSASHAMTSNGGYIILNMTGEGRDKVAAITKELADAEDKVLYFYVSDKSYTGGENSLSTDEAIINLSVNEEIDQRTLYVGGSFTEERAQALGIVINSCIKYGTVNLSMNVGNVSEVTLGTHSGAVIALYIIFAVAIVAMFVYSIVRYKGLGVVHALAYLSFLICMVMYMAFLPGMALTATGVVALLVTSVLFVLSEYYVFENVRKEFNVGKTLQTAISDGYRKSLAGILDSHIVLFIMGLLLYLISIGEMVPFAYIFFMGVLMSGVISLVIARFYFYCMRGVVARSAQYKFCGFKREVIDDDDED